MDRINSDQSAYKDAQREFNRDYTRLTVYLDRTDVPDDKAEELKPRIAEEMEKLSDTAQRVLELTAQDDYEAAATFLAERTTQVKELRSWLSQQCAHLDN